MQIFFNVKPFSTDDPWCKKKKRKRESPKKKKKLKKKKATKKKGKESDSEEEEDDEFDRALTKAGLLNKAPTQFDGRKFLTDIFLMVGQLNEEINNVELSFIQPRRENLPCFLFF